MKRGTEISVNFSIPREIEMKASELERRMNEEEVRRALRAEERI